MNVIIAIFLLLFSTSAYADYLGCFEPNEAVEIKTLYLNISGVLTDPTSPACNILDPNDTTLTACTSGPTKVGTLTGIYESSHTIPASPLEGVWIVKQAGTVDSVVKDAADYFMVVDVAGECPGRAGVKISDGTGTGQIDTLNGAIVNIDTIDPIATGTENGASTATRIYWNNAINQRTRVGMCMEVTVGSNTERSIITGAGAGYNDVKGFSATPVDATAVAIYPDGCR